MEKIRSSISISLCDIYVLLWALHEYADMFVHTSLSTLGTFFSMMLISLYFFCRLLSKYQLEGYFKSLVIFLMFLSIYGLIYILGGHYVYGTKPTSFLLGNWSSLAPILVFYLSTLNGYINEKKMLIYCVVFLVMAVTRFEYYYSTSYLEMGEYFTNTGFTNNASYFFVCLLPFTFLLDSKPVLKYLLLLVCIYFVMNGMKRGAILVTGVFFVYYLWATVFSQKNKKITKKQIISAILFCATLFAISKFVKYSWIGNDYFNYRFQTMAEGDTNGRVEIYSILWDEFSYNSNIFQMLFGHGAEGTIQIAQMHAHNDWLELLTDCGIIGVIVYLIYFISFYKECKRYKDILPEKNIIFSSMLILFVTSFFSMSFMDMYLGISCALGYGMAMCKRKKILQLHEQKNQ